MKSGRAKRPPKHPDILGTVRRCGKAGTFLLKIHGAERQEERLVSRKEIEYVLENGSWEKSRDRYSEVEKKWSYAFKGRTLDSDLIRVVVSIEVRNDNEKVYVITVVVL